MSVLKVSVLKHQHEYLRMFLNDVSVWALLFIGGFGSGKSYTLSVTAVMLLLKYPGTNIGCYSVTFDLLKLVNIQQICERLDELGLKFTLNKSDMILKVHGYGKIIFRSLDNPVRIIGYEHGFALIDEIDTLPEVKATDAWNKVIARNRQRIWFKGDKIRNKVGAFSTPEGFRFCYRRWDKEKIDGYELVRAKTAENTFLPPEYIDNLRASYPPHLIEAYLNGEFVNLNGGAVYHCFERRFHSFNADEMLGIQEENNVVAFG